MTTHVLGRPVTWQGGGDEVVGRWFAKHIQRSELGVSVGHIIDHNRGKMPSLLMLKFSNSVNECQCDGRYSFRV